MTSTSTHRRLGRALAVPVAAAALLAPAATAGSSRSYGPPDPWVRYAASTTRANTPDPWFGYALSLARANTTTSSPLITDTLAPGGGTADSNRGYTFVTDTLAPGGGSTQTQGYRFTTDTLAPGGSQGGQLSSGRSFSWPDAGVGAGVAVGSIFCLFAGALVLARRRDRLAV
jgi:hypothetical protein